MELKVIVAEGSLAEHRLAPEAVMDEVQAALARMNVAATLSIVEEDAISPERRSEMKKNADRLPARHSAIRFALGSAAIALVGCLLCKSGVSASASLVVVAILANAALGLAIRSLPCFGVSLVVGLTPVAAEHLGGTTAQAIPEIAILATCGAAFIAAKEVFGRSAFAGN
ncbi:hypothetical protein [Paraburkholderia fungorum]|uniref:CBS domain containing-hemolysin-like protein n=1 Tax=Paraburkholderia fungorum TaxID=134537 RepID=A0AAW3V126_9BURK|nr:hypothetical protein [Paraburkholderia fungorum]MBB4517201.1 CBS domain containing-hemolysin-like protein [Paraburkholderia fungorum]MBB6204269.1 CBS domain containing-hemolysin-like protein [Paraburkholderia fungorum]